MVKRRTITNPVKAGRVRKATPPSSRRTIPGAPSGAKVGRGGRTGGGGKGK